LWKHKLIAGGGGKGGGGAFDTTDIQFRVLTGHGNIFEK
jgi:hypothetical protein